MARSRRGLWLFVEAEFTIFTAWLNKYKISYIWNLILSYAHSLIPSIHSTDWSTQHAHGHTAQTPFYLNKQSTRAVKVKYMMAVHVCEPHYPGTRTHWISLGFHFYSVLLYLFLIRHLPFLLHLATVAVAAHVPSCIYSKPSGGTWIASFPVHCTILFAVKTWLDAGFINQIIYWVYFD